MPKHNRNRDYDNQRSSGIYNKDSLDHYNEDLSKKAVGSIFSNIERDNAEEPEPEDYVIDTNFNIKNNKVRKELVGQFFNDDDDLNGSKRRPKQARPQPTREPKRTPAQNQRPQSDVNSAFSRDDDTIATKFVTRGNHQPVTPAMAARRKNVTMMESQRMPIITDEEIADYKKQNTRKNIAYVNNLDNKETAPVDFDDYINNNDITSEQKEIIEYLRNEETKKAQNFENTLHRLNEKNKHFHDIIESTNQRLNSIQETADFDEYEDEEAYDKEYNNEYQIHFEDAAQDFDNTSNLDDVILFGTALNEGNDEFEFTSQDLEADFEETIESNSRSKKSKPFIPTNNLHETQHRRQQQPIVESENEEYYDLETDSYVTQKNKYSTGEVKKINDTIATEISIDELDDFVFDNYDTADMEYLRKTIKERTKAQKMQKLDNKIHEFEKNHRDFNGKQNVPPKTVPKQRPVKQAPPEEPQHDSYEYRKSRKKIEKPTSYDTDSYRTSNYDTSSHRNSDYDTGSHKQRDYDSSAYNTSSVTSRLSRTQTSKISTVDLEPDDYVDEYATKFNVSLVANFLLGVALVVVATWMFMKTSALESNVATLTATNAELLSQSGKVTELEMELDYYKNLYYGTEEGQLSLLETETEESNDDTSSEEISSGNNSQEFTSYTVVSGDTLSSISRKFYGNSNEYQKIIDANNLTTDSLNLGQILKIPN